MSIALLIITDKVAHKDCLDRTLRSLSGAWQGPGASLVVVVDDTGVPEYRKWLDRRLSGWGAVIVSHQVRRGFSAAIATGWATIAAHPAVEWVVHVEDDFLFTPPFEIPAMIRLLTAYPYLAQVSLLRQAVNEAELAAGGLVESRPGQFINHTDLDRKLHWMEQRSYFTTNPSVYPRVLLDVGWPQEPQSEGLFTHRLLTDGFGDVAGKDVAFGVWGHTGDPPRVTHIGVRQGTGY
jgi:hypothetical protein